jgi:hypothetical protein
MLRKAININQANPFENPSIISESGRDFLCGADSADIVVVFAGRRCSPG